MAGADSEEQVTYAGIHINSFAQKPDYFSASLVSTSMSTTIHTALSVGCLSLALVGCSKTVAWEEEVKLRDGQTTVVKMKQRESRWQWPDAEHVLDYELRASLAGNRIHWSRDPLTGRLARPLLIDVVDGQAVVVVGVAEGWCEVYGYPAEGYAAWTWRDGTWQRLQFARLPEDIRLNVFRGTAADGAHLSVEDKSRQSDKHLLYGADLAAFEAASLRSRFACGRQRPQRSVAQRQALQDFSAAERTAPLRPVQGEATAAPASAQPENRRRSWKGSGFVLGCDGLVATVDQVFEQGGHVGYRLLRSEDGPSDFDIDLVPARAGDLAVLCAESAIFVVLARDARAVSIHRYLADGRHVGVLKVNMQDITDSQQWYRPSALDFSGSTLRLTMTLFGQDGRPAFSRRYSMAPDW